MTGKHLNSKRVVLCSVALSLSLILISSCVTTDTHAPDWWENPHQDDQWDVYVKASAAGLPTEEKARQKAYDNALVLISKRIVANVQNATSDSNSNRLAVKTSGQLKNTTIAAEKTHQSGSQWSAWVLVKYPRKEFDQVYDYLQWPHKTYQQAMAAQAKHDYDTAQNQFESILARYPIGQQTCFDSERVYIDMARMARERRMYVTAASYYRKILAEPSARRDLRRKAKTELDSLPKPTPLDVVRERLTGHVLAVNCANITGKPSPLSSAVVSRINELHIKALKVNATPATVLQAARGAKADFSLLLTFKTIPDFKPIANGDIVWCLVNTKWRLLNADGKQLGGGHLQTKWTASNPEAAKVATIVAINVLFNEKLAKDVIWD